MLLGVIWQLLCTIIMFFDFCRGMKGFVCSTYTNSNLHSHLSCSCRWVAQDPWRLWWLCALREADGEVRRGARLRRKKAARKHRRGEDSRCCGNPASVVFTPASCCHCTYFLSQRNSPISQLTHPVVLLSVFIFPPGLLKTFLLTWAYIPVAFLSEFTSLCFRKLCWSVNL